MTTFFATFATVMRQLLYIFLLQFVLVALSSCQMNDGDTLAVAERTLAHDTVRGTQMLDTCAHDIGVMVTGQPLAQDDSLAQLAIMGQVCEDRQFTDSATYYYTRALASKEAEVRKMALYGLYRLYIKQGDTITANRYKTQLAALHGYSAQAAYDIQQLRSLYDCKLLDMERQQLRERQQTTMFALSFLIVLLVVLAAMCWFYYTTSRAIRKRDAKLDAVLSMLTDTQRTNFILQGSPAVRQLTQEAANADTPLTDDFFLRLQHEVEDVCPTFTDDLRAAYPDINEKELRLCLLQKVGMPQDELLRAIGLARTTVANMKRDLATHFGEVSTKGFDRFIAGC